MRKIKSTGTSLDQKSEKPAPGKNEIINPFEELERGVYAALETYSNVHRGSGHKSMVSSYLFEQAREIVLDYLGLNNVKYVVIFCTHGRAVALKAQLEPGNYQSVSSQDFGLPIGVTALAVNRKALPGGAPFETGGGTARLVSPGWVVWDKVPDKFEAGTPAIINVIALARAICLIRQYGKEIFMGTTSEILTAAEILYSDELEKSSGKALLDKLRLTMIGHNIPVPTVEGRKPFINLDNSASTPSFGPIWNTFRQTLQQPRQVQEEIINQVRSLCAEMLGFSPEHFDLIFTSNTTEAINLLAGNLNSKSGEGIEPVVLSTILEHTSNDLPWRMVPEFSIIRLQADDEGFLDLKAMEAILSEYNQKLLNGKKRIRILTISGASNVLGSFNNLSEISRIVHKYGAHLLVDGAQLVAHRKVEMERCRIDCLAFSAHKMYAPFGTGVLVVKKGLLNFKTEELEQIQLSGEENVAGIAALGKAIVLLQRIGMDLIQEEEHALTRRTLSSLSQIKGLRIYGMNDPDSPRFSQKGGVIVFSLKGIMANRLAKELAEQGGIGVRYGCHCAHILVKHILGVPPLLERFQGVIVKLFPKLRLPGLVRISLGIENTGEDVDNLVHVLRKIAGNHRAPANRQSDTMQNVKTILSRSEIEEQIQDFLKAASRRVYS